MAAPEYNQRGIHGFRHNYAQSRLQLLQQHDINQDDAKAISKEMKSSSNIDDIQVYLAFK